MKIVIELPIISGNKLLRMFWAKRAKIQRDYLLAILDETIGVKKGEQKKVKAVITSYRKRLLDTDNLYSGIKPLGDALKKAGLIWDDSPKWINLKARQIVDSKNPRTEIVIENVEI